MHISQEAAQDLLQAVKLFQALDAPNKRGEGYAIFAAAGWVREDRFEYPATKFAADKAAAAVSKAEECN